MVRKGGFEPPRPCEAQAPEACASASSATSANGEKMTVEYSTGQLGVFTLCGRVYADVT